MVMVLPSPPFSRRGRWIPQRSAEFNGGGYTGCSRQMVLEPLQLLLLGKMLLQPPPFSHVLRIVPEHPLLE